MEVGGKQGEVECIIPTKVLSEVLSILGSVLKDAEGGGGQTTSTAEQQTVDVTFSSQQVEIDIGRTTVLSRLIDGSFPKYEQIIPSGSTSKLSVPLAELLSNIKRMHYFAKESNNNLTMSIKPGELNVQTQQTQFGRDETTLSVEVEGEENKIALSSAYLLDFLSHVSGESVEMEVTDKMHPAVFRLPGHPNFLHLIMPLRLTEDE
jgi:DNA polymerase-3 subunit beta